MTERPSGPATLAEFATMNDLLEATALLRAAGYREIELYTPYPPESGDEVLGIPRPRALPALTLWIGLLGATLTVAVQWFANAWNYPINVGGRPLLAFPAWIPITFELGVLSASFAAAGGLVAVTGLPRLWHPVFEIDDFHRATVDRFWLAVPAGGPGVDPMTVRRDLEALHPLRLVRTEAAP